MTIEKSTVETTTKFSVQNFAPVWGAAVMGTAVIAVIFAVLELRVIALVALAVALIVAVPVLGITAFKWIKYPRAVLADLNHPVKGGMSATLAGGILVLAVAINRVLAEEIAAGANLILTLALTTIGGALALFIGFMFLSGIFARGNIKPEMITGVWFIPPVVTIIVPTALAPFKDLHSEINAISWVFLGIGTMLYMVIVAILFYRSAVAPLPPAPLAPSLIIGMGPAGLIGLNLVLLANDMTLAVATGAATIFWGFGLWWGIAALFVLARGYKKLPFTLSWWGFTFPLGAWVVAGFVIAKVTASVTIAGFALIGSAILVVLWLYIAYKTLKGIRSGAVWAA